MQTATLDDVTSPVEVNIPVPPAVLESTPIGGAAVALTTAAHTAYAAAADHADAVSALSKRQTPTTRRRAERARAAATLAVDEARHTQLRLGEAAHGNPGKAWQSELDRERADAYRRLRDALADVDTATRRLDTVDDAQAYLDALRLAARDPDERWPVGYGTTRRTIRIGGRRATPTDVANAVRVAYR